MIWSRKSTKNKQPVDNYATVDDFGEVFTEHMNELYQLAFLLTANAHKAEKCFVAGLEDAVKENHVFKEWARTWAKRVIIQNAIREVKPHKDGHHSFAFGIGPYVAESRASEEKHFELDAVLRLEDFDRFVFVSTVLAEYSEYSCSLLLVCSPRDIHEARVRAMVQLANARGTVPPTHSSFEAVQERVQ